MSSNARSSAHLGATLRSVLLAPQAGFEAAFRHAARRERTSERRPEGRTPYVLSAVGGAAVFLLWLKLSPLLGLRTSSVEHYRWEFIVIAALMGAVLGLVAQFLWGLVGPLLARIAGGEAASRDLRTVWGAAAFPQVFALALLVPLDLLVVGPETYTSARAADGVAAGWSALSVALGVALVAWSGLIFVKGHQAAAKVGLWRAVAIASGGGLAAVLVVAGCRFALTSLSGGGA